MKNNIFFVLMILILACNIKKEKVSVLNLSEIIFTKDTFDFNTVKKGDSIKATFRFKNNGKSELLIKNMNVPCGCTKVSSYKDNIPADEYGSIDVVYHSDNDTNFVIKTIIIETNSKPKLHVLYIKGTVQ